jgi:hypothetical protein
VLRRPIETTALIGTWPNHEANLILHLGIYLVV